MTNETQKIQEAKEVYKFIQFYNLPLINFINHFMKFTSNIIYEIIFFNLNFKILFFINNYNNFF
jgi:hypothetical protein